MADFLRVPLKIGIQEHGGHTRQMLTIEIGRGGKHGTYYQPQLALDHILEWFRRNGVELPTAEQEGQIT